MKKIGQNSKVKLPQAITFVDVETTGGSFSHDRIIEIGLIKVVDGLVKQTYTKLINPETHISPFITQITGINQEDLYNAPTFSEIKDEIYEYIADTTLAAHNVRFDYGFIKNEFERTSVKIKLPHFCTVKLCRLLYPGRRKYNLDALIKYFNIMCLNRHRALDDAKVIWEFFNIAKREIPQKIFNSAMHQLLKRPSLPPGIKEKDIEKLKSNPGVYIFYGDSEIPLYIGKSNNIKNRVLSHFTDSAKITKEERIHRQIKSIDSIETAGDLTASLLESQLIKKLKPLHNQKLREKKKMLILLESENSHGYKVVETAIVDKIDIDKIDKIINVFKSKKQIESFLSEIAKQYKLCPKLLKLTKTEGPCIYTQLEWCKGACENKENPFFYNARFIEAFGKYKFQKWPFEGPIIVKEKNKNKEESLIINKWCIIKKISVDLENNIDEKESNLKFDLDVYKIIHSYLKRTPDKIMICRDLRKS